MDSATTQGNTAARPSDSARTQSRAASSSSQTKERPQNPASQPKLTDYGVTVKGRFDPDLRRFFVTILDTSSQTLIVQFPSQAAARYAQQLTKAASQTEADPKNEQKKAAPESSLDQNA